MRMGRFFGEDSLLSGAPYEHTVVAASALGLFYLDKQYIETHMGQLEVCVCVCVCVCVRAMMSPLCQG